MKKNKKKIVIGIIVLLLVVIGLTYAYLIVTRTATKENEVVFGCIDISLENEANDISLINQFPISDEEGMNLTPYTFTVKNNCDNDISYYINLEAIGTEADSIRSSSIKIMLDENAPVILGDKFVGQTTIETAYKAHLLKLEELEPNGSADHTLRIWLDKDAPLDERQKTFTSKITVTTTQPIQQPEFGENTLAAAVINNSGQFGIYPELTNDWKVGDKQTGISKSFNTTSRYCFAKDYYFDPYKKTFQLLSRKCVTIEDYRNEHSDLIYTLGTIEGDETGLTSTTLYVVTSLTNDSNADTDTTKYLTVDTKTAVTDYKIVDEQGLFKTNDDYGTSYYFRGDVKNNYVQFGTYAKDQVIGYRTASSTLYYSFYDSLEACTSASTNNKNCVSAYKAGDPMYWRIVRINGDGTIRLVYDGPEMVENGTKHQATIGNSKYNSTGGAEEYIGYTYLGDDGTQIDSTVKSYIDDWYELHLKTNYEQYIADSIFCNDRTDGTKYKAPYDRVTNFTPTLKCPSDEDKYTVNSNNGNGYLTNPIGMISMDEAMVVGLPGTTASSFLYSGERYWSMSSARATGYVYGVFDSVAAGSGAVVVTATTANVRPVINLKADVEFTGIGTIESPYVITTN